MLSTQPDARSTPMKHFHYVEIRNFKCFGNLHRIELDNPSILIGPNNCGKTSVLQAIALWSKAVQTWVSKKGEEPPKNRPATSLNRLELVAVPVPRTRFLWHNTVVRTGRNNIKMEVAVGLEHEGRVESITMQFRNQGDDLVYCQPSENSIQRPALLKAAAAIKVELLYPLSGLQSEEPVFQPGWIDALVGQGLTAQVLRNLCMQVITQSEKDWSRVANWIKRLFHVDLGYPIETPRGTIELTYRQEGVKHALGIALAGRGLQQCLLLLTTLYSKSNSVLLIDEPDSHLEALRQRQLDVLLTEIANERGSQVILATHSEVMLQQACERNLTLLLDGEVHNLSKMSAFRNALSHYGAPHYIRARQYGHVLYVEGRTDLDILLAFARRIGPNYHPLLDPTINAYFVKNNHPVRSFEASLEKAEYGFGMGPEEHFYALRELLPQLRALAILDGNTTARQDSCSGGLDVRIWRRYEIENYFVLPELLLAYVNDRYREQPLFASQASEVLNPIILEQVFSGSRTDFDTWLNLDPVAKRLLWQKSTERIKLSSLAETFFRELAAHLGTPMMLRKSSLYEMINHMEPSQIDAEVVEKLDALRNFLLEKGFDRSAGSLLTPC